MAFSRERGGAVADAALRDFLCSQKSNIQTAFLEVVFRRSKSVGAKIILASQMRVKNRRQPSTAGASKYELRQRLI
jgi:hypothetical protein